MTTSLDDMAPRPSARRAAQARPYKQFAASHCPDQTVTRSYAGQNPRAMTAAAKTEERLHAGIRTLNAADATRLRSCLAGLTERRARDLERRRWIQLSRQGGYGRFGALSDSAIG